MRGPYMYKEERRELCVKYGILPKYAGEFRDKWTKTRANAKVKGVLCTLTFEDYLRKAVRAGIYKPSHIGMYAGSFQLSRKRDKGDYSNGNCAFKPAEVNRLEQKLNGGNAKAAEKKFKKFEIFSPNGKKFRGSGLIPFCGKHGLNRSRMGLVCNGKISHHKGWTGRFVEMVEEELE